MVAVAGAVFCCVSALLYIGLFYQVNQLPAEQQLLETLSSRTPTMIRLVVLGASAGLLNLVALVLSSIGLMLRQRSKWLATAGTIASILMLLSLASVVILGAVAS